MSDTETHQAECPTAIVAPDEAATRHATELAWSLTEDLQADIPTERYSWSSTLTRAGLLAIAAAVVAGLIAVAGLVWMVTPTRQPAQLPQAAPSVQASPPDVVVPPPPITPSPPVQQEQPAVPDVPVADQAFAKAMEADGITAIGNDWPQLIYNAKRICWGFAHNISRAEIMKETQQVSKLPDQGVNDYVGLATAFYCPQYGSNS